MAAPTPVTEPGVQCSASAVPPAGTRLSVRSGEPPLRLVSSANGATGRSSGTFTSATSDAAVRGHDRGGLELAARAHHDDALRAAQEVGGGGDESALGHGDADERHLPWAVVACSSTMERPAACGGRRHGVLRPGQGGDGCRPRCRAWRSGAGARDAGERSTTTQATAAMTAATPTSTMTALR